jgi:hypothetical protein
MGRTGPVVRAGLVARARRGGAMVTAVTATAAMFLAGCGTRTADLPARGGPAPAATASTGPGPGRGRPAGSRAAAQALAHRLLAGLILPPGGRPVRMRTLPPLLRLPQGSYGGTHAARVHRLFLLSEPITAVQGFLMAHQPAGMKRSGYGQGVDPGSGRASGKAVQPGQITMASVSYQPRSLPDGIYSAELDTTVVPAPGGGALVRADAEAIWYPARTAAEQVDPARYRAAVVSISLFNPGQHTVTRTVTSARAIAWLAGLVNRLPGAPYQPANCPAVVANFRIAFVPADSVTPRVLVTPSGCMTVGVMAGGAAQPPLWGDTGLIAAAKRLLHVKSLL